MQWKLFSFAFFSIFFTVINNKLIALGMNLNGLWFEACDCSLDFDFMDEWCLIVFRVILIGLMTLKGYRFW
jgi:hypothetical protein